AARRQGRAGCRWRGLARRWRRTHAALDRGGRGGLCPVRCLAARAASGTGTLCAAAGGAGRLSARGDGRRHVADLEVLPLGWRGRAAVRCPCEKAPARASGGMVVTNRPLASAAGAEMLAAGGNAVDAAIAALFTLSVVEPMMVGIFGGGMAHIRMSNGKHVVLDGQSAAPVAATPDMYRAVSEGRKR